MRVRLTEDYPNWFWNSGSGVTLTKEDREGVEANLNDRMVKIALEQGFLELVTEEALQKERAERIITDIPPEKTIKEVVTPENDKELKEIKNNERDSDKSSTGKTYKF